MAAGSVLEIVELILEKVKRDDETKIEGVVNCMDGNLQTPVDIAFQNNFGSGKMICAVLFKKS